MSADELFIIEKLGACRYAPATWSKRFVRDLYHASKDTPEVELSELQKAWIYRILYTKRKQLPHTFNRYKKHPDCKPLKTTKTK